MKHILGMLKPYANLGNTSRPKIELDYLRLVYAISEMRKRGDDAQGYFIITDIDMQERLNRLEKCYHGNEYVKVLKVSLESSLRLPAPNEKKDILSGIVRTAIMDTGSSSSAATIRQKMREFMLAETILGLEPGFRHVNDESRFPFHIQWDFYGVVEDKRGGT